MARPLTSALAAAALTATANGACAQAQDSASTPQLEPGRLMLQATGSIAAAPDMAQVSAGVIADGDTAQTAMESQRRNMNGVVDALTSAGVEARDIQTSSFTLSPVYANYSASRSDEGPKVTGYRASNQVTVVARDLDAIGPTLDALVAAGANNIGGVSFGVSNEAELLDQARQEAVATLLARAELYAGAANFQLGRILDMSESGGMRPVAMMRTRAMEMDSAPTPISGGEMTIAVTVNATFAIEP